MKKRRLLILVLLLLIGGVLFITKDTWAKYFSEATANKSISVAKWDFDTENLSKELTIDVSPTADPSTLVADKIAPGTEGSFGIDLTNANSDVGVEFKLAIGTVSGLPTNLKFYKDNTYTEELTTAEITGTIAAGDATGLTANIYWKWPYETPTGSTAGDAADTADGKAAADLALPITITGTQVPPSQTAVTTKLN